MRSALGPLVLGAVAALVAAGTVAGSAPAWSERFAASDRNGGDVDRGTMAPPAYCQSARDDIRLSSMIPPREYAAIVGDLAPRLDLDPRLVIAVMAVESAFRPRAVSPKGARGLMQLIPSTADRFGVDDPFNPRQNIEGGMKYLRWLLDYFSGNVALALAGYNAGEKAVLHYGDIPPYRETQAYVSKVLSLYEWRGPIGEIGDADAPLWSAAPWMNAATRAERLAACYREAEKNTAS